MPEYLVDLSAADTWAAFVTAFNEGFIRHIGGDWNGNLDSFNDYLYWPSEHPYRLVVQGWTTCAPNVNRHMAPDGRPVLEVIAEIFCDNPQVDVVMA